MSVPYPSIQPLEQQPLVGTSTDASGSRSWGQQPLFFFFLSTKTLLRLYEKKRRITDPKTLQNSVLAIEQDSVCESLWRQWQKVKGWMTKRAEARRRDLTRLLCVVSAAPTWMFFCVCVCWKKKEKDEIKNTVPDSLSLVHIFKVLLWQGQVRRGGKKRLSRYWKFNHSTHVLEWRR